MFSVQSVSLDPLMVTFQLTAASLKLGQSQNGVLGNGLKQIHKIEIRFIVTNHS